MRNKNKGRLAPFVPVDIEMMDSPAWRATSHGARWLYMHLKRRYSFKQKNNGRIFLSLRHAVKEMGGTLDSVARWFRELQHYGFISMTEAGCLGVDGRGKAPHWRLTEFEAPGGRNGNTLMLPTKDYLKWGGTKFQDDRGDALRQRKLRQRARAEKQNPVHEIRDRVSMKYRTVLSRKYRTLRPATVHEIQDISTSPPVHEIRDISRSTTLQPASADLPPPAPLPWMTPSLTELLCSELPGLPGNLRPSPDPGSSAAGVLPGDSPQPAPPRPMPPGDRRREEIRARNAEALRRFDPVASRINSNTMEKR